MIRINRLNIIFLIGFIFSACEKDDNNFVVSKEELRTHTTLIVNNYHMWYGNPSWKENALFEVYSNLNSYMDYFTASLPWEKREINSDTLPSSLFNNSFEILDDYYRETFKYDNVEYGTYYLKSFNAYHHEKLVEFNDVFEFDVSSPLDSLEVVNVLTKRYYIKSFNLKEMHICLNNESLNTSKNKVNIKGIEDIILVDYFDYGRIVNIVKDAKEGFKEIEFKETVMTL